MFAIPLRSGVKGLGVLTCLAGLIVFPASDSYCADADTCADVRGLECLELRIGLEKSVHLLGEPIWVEVKLTNTSQDTVLLPMVLSIASRSLRFKVISDSGEALDDIGDLATFAGVRPPLPPGEHDHSPFRLEDFYGKFVKGAGGIDSEVPVGSYSMFGVGFGKLRSNTLEFEVIEPVGNDAVIHDALNKAAASLWSMNKTSAEAALAPLLPQLHGSPYRGKVLFMLSQAFLFDKDKRRPVLTELLELDHDGGFARYAGAGLVSLMTEAEAEAFVDHLERTSPDSRAAQAARKRKDTLWSKR